MTIWCSLRFSALWCWPRRQAPYIFGDSTGLEPGESLVAFRQIDRSFPVGIRIQCDETQHMYFRFMFIRVLYSLSVKEIFIPTVNHEQIPTNANDPQKQTQQLWIKKVHANPCRWELCSINRTSNRNLARATKKKLLEYYYRRWHKLAVIKQTPLHIRLNPSTVTPISFWQLEGGSNRVNTLATQLWLRCLNDGNPIKIPNLF